LWAKGVGVSLSRDLFGELRYDNAPVIARRLKRDLSTVGRLCADYEMDRDLRTEKKIAEVVGTQFTTQA
jgi:hypothetical protein